MNCCCICSEILVKFVKKKLNLSLQCFSFALYKWAYELFDIATVDLTLEITFHTFTAKDMITLVKFHAVLTHFVSEAYLTSKVFLFKF